LRERKEDITLLATHFLSTKSPVRAPKKLSAESEKILFSYSFPGNIRELEHIIERAIIFAEGDVIRPDDLNLPHMPASKETVIQEIEEDASVLSMEEIEKRHIANVLKRNRWDRTQTANQLGISPKTLYTKIKKYEIKQE
jgi:DNA-binding NtrC family response regulator